MDRLGFGWKELLRMGIIVPVDPLAHAAFMHSEAVAAAAEAAAAAAAAAGRGGQGAALPSSRSARAYSTPNADLVVFRYGFMREVLLRRTPVWPHIVALRQR